MINVKSSSKYLKYQITSHGAKVTLSIPRANQTVLTVIQSVPKDVLDVRFSDDSEEDLKLKVLLLERLINKLVDECVIQSNAEAHRQ